MCANVCTRSVQRRDQDKYGFRHLVEFLEHHHSVCLAFCKGLQMSFREYKHSVATFISHNHSVRWNQKILLDMTEKTLKAVVNGCAWGLRDSQGSLLNQSWQILTTSPEVQRVLNHRPCDQRHKHGRLPDHFSAFSLQFLQSLCQTLAKQFLVKGSWNSRWAFWNSCMPRTMGDHSILLLPVGKIRLVWTLHHQRWTLIAMLTCRQQSHLLLKQVRPRLREEITNWLQKIHQQIGHRDNRTLVILLKQRGIHPWVLKMAHDHRCSACEECKPPALRHITSSYENVPGAILEIDGMHWQHAVTGHVLRWSLCLRKLENVQIVTIKLQSARNPC